MVVGMLLAASIANAYDKIFNLSLSEFDNFQISEGGVTLNNFSLAENNAFMARGSSKVQVSFSIRNRNADTRAVTVMIVGMSGSTILWAVDAGPSMSMVSANKTEECNGSAYVSAGTVGQTTRIWLRVVGNL